MNSCCKNTNLINKDNYYFCTNAECACSKIRVVSLGPMNPVSRDIRPRYPGTGPAHQI